MVNPGLMVVCIVSAIEAIAMLWVTCDIVADGRNSDADKQMKAAAAVKQWKYISDMHKFAGGKAWLKDAAVLCLVVFQRITKDYQSFRPVAALCIMAHSLTAILIYLVSSAYWNSQVGLVIYELYLTSFWPYQAILQGGYHVLGMMFFCLSVYFLQQAVTFGHLYYFLSGVAIGLMMFSSASSRKMLPLFVPAYFFSQRHLFLPVWKQAGGWGFFLQGVGLKFMLAFLAAAGLAVFCLLLINASFNKIVTVLYHGQGPALFKRIFMREKNAHTLETYLAKKKSLLRFLKTFSLGLLAYILFTFLCYPYVLFFLSQLLIIAGILCIVVLFTLPDIRANLNGFYSYWLISKWGGRFQHYIDFFAKRGIAVTKDTRGAGVKWYPLFFWRMIPFHFSAYLVSVAAILYFTMQNHSAVSWPGAAVILISLLPVIYSELSGAVQFARTYLPVFLSILLVLGYALFFAAQNISLGMRPLYWGAVWVFALFSAAWNIRVFVGDVLPAKIFATYMVKTLDARGIKKFYTYDTPYNDSCAFMFDCVGSSKFQMEFINSLKEAEQGYVVVPGTSSKSSAVEGLGYAINHGDYDEDPVLNELLRSKGIERFAIASFKTVGCSKYWGQEGEVPSYRDLILKDIKASDRYRSRAWILDAAKLQREYFKQAV